MGFDKTTVSRGFWSLDKMIVAVCIEIFPFWGSKLRQNIEKYSKPRPNIKNIFALGSARGWELFDAAWVA